MHHPTNASVEGVIVLSPSLHVLHMSPRATQLIGALTIGPRQNPSGLTLPADLHDIGHETRNQLLTSLRQGNGLTCNVERMISSLGATLFVRGLGAPDQGGGEFFTVLVVSESPVTIPSVEQDGRS